MRIRSEQIKVLSDHLMADFESRTIAHLRKHHGRKLLSHSDEDIRTFIHTCIDRAKHLYGLESEQAVVCYCQLPLILGPGFELPANFFQVPIILAQRSIEENTRAKLALALAYQINPSADESP